MAGSGNVLKEVARLFSTRPVNYSDPSGYLTINAQRAIATGLIVGVLGIAAIAIDGSVLVGVAARGIYAWVKGVPAFGKGTGNANGWKVGDPITNNTKAGNQPAWSCI